MSQRTRKCTVCGGAHAMLQCENKCGVCNGDNRQCSCTVRPTQKRKKTAKSASSNPQRSYDELQKKYEALLKDHDRVGLAFQNQKEQNQELAQELQERESEAEELANIIRTKDEVVKNLERRLVNAKKVIHELRAEVEQLKQNDQPEREEPPTEQQQQHQQRNGSRVSTHSLASIHERHDQVMNVMMENRCSMACAFRLASCPRSTVRDFVAIAELKKVDARELDLVLRDQQVASVKQLETLCRRRLRRFIPVMENMRREGKLLPLKFDQRFYE
ncbi:uncharacterized protein LOC144644673 [Oculina patagonica]